jgi:hypothetical protein
MRTLSKLYEFCSSNPTYKVLYLHMKGGTNNELHNINSRKVLDAYTLNTGCIPALDKGFDTCGFRLSPLPYIHYSGNFWWARCEYVSSLADPGLFFMGSASHQTLTGEMMKLVPAEDLRDHYERSQMRMWICAGVERFFGEAWICSHPRVSAADCIAGSEFPSYLYGFHVWNMVVKASEPGMASEGNGVTCGQRGRIDRPTCSRNCSLRGSG